jgi:hypothetical protein
MRPYYRVFRANGLEGSSHKINTRQEAQAFAESQCGGSGGDLLEIALIIGISTQPKTQTFWCDGCVDTDEPAG